MAFHWKDPKDIWKGEGIYHLTFVIAGRYPLLGHLEAIDPMQWPGYVGLNQGRHDTVKTVAQFSAIDEKENDFQVYYSDRCQPKPIDAEGHIAKVCLTPLGYAISNDLKNFEQHHPGMKLVAKMVMPDHLHVVVWVQKNGLQTIRQVGHGIRMGITHIAKELGVWPIANTNSPESSSPTSIPLFISSSLPPFVGSLEACHASTAPQGLILEQPFIRTLSRKGQLKALCQYVHDNAYRRWMKMRNPELFTLHRDTMIEKLRFRSMGNHWLLDWPERHMVECSRSIRTDELEQLEQHCLLRAEQGAVTYSAAISEGERAIVRKIREAGYPVVILLKDGFPPIGSDKERFYKPGGVYFQSCLVGNLLLLEAYDETYETTRIVAATESRLQLKAQERHQSYQSLPHNSLRWRYMAGNEIVRCLVELE